MQCRETTRILSSCIAGLLLAIPVLAGAKESYRTLSSRICPILDTPYRTLSSLEVGYIFPAETTASGWGELSAAEADIWVRCIDWENSAGGDLEIKAQWHSMTLLLSADNDIFTLARGAFFVQWSQRFEQGFGIQINATPGIYSSLEGLSGDAFSVPVGLIGIKAISPNLGFFAGANGYPGFHRVIDPVLGVRWSSNSDAVRLDVGYPETRLDFLFARRVRLVSGARLWLWPDYCLSEDDTRERLRYQEGRAYAGLEWLCTEYTMLSVKYGYLFSREVSFEASDDSVDVEDAPFAAISIGGIL